MRKAKKSKDVGFKLIGELKKPIDIQVNGKEIKQVVRILGDKEWGFIYEFLKDNKRFRTGEPLWHNEWSKHKRNDMPKLGAKVRIKWDKQVVQTIELYLGHGYYRVRNEQGQKINAHFHAIQKI